MKLKPLALVLLTAGLLAGCSQVSAGTQAVEVDSYGDPVVSGCAKEETQVGTMTVDLYRYPARAISWDANSDPGAERGPYQALSKPKSTPPADASPEELSNVSTGQAEMAIPMTITFDMTTDCDKLKDFHRNYGTKYQGWLNDDGTVSDGWKQLLNYTVSQPAEQAVIGITQKYPWQKVWNDEGVRNEYKQALQTRLPKESAARTGGVDYFTNFVVTVGKPYPTDERLRQSISDQQSSQAAADAERIRLTSQADAEKAAAESQRAAAVAQRDAEIAKAQIVAAKIAGYPDVESYLRAQAIEKGITPWPSPIIAGAR